jgi:hypothetical protein
MRGGERNEGHLNKEQGDGVGDGSLQSHSGANLHLNMAKDRVDVPKGGKADGVSPTTLATQDPKVSGKVDKVAPRFGLLDLSSCVDLQEPWMEGLRSEKVSSL